jgi:hypothetical protein
MTPTHRDPWFAPRYRRIAVVAVCLVWLALEAWAGEQVWTLIAVAVTGYAVWALLIAYRPPEER